MSKTSKTQKSMNQQTVDFILNAAKHPPVEAPMTAEQFRAKLNEWANQASSK